MLFQNNLQRIKKKSPPCHAVINMAEFLRKKCEEPGSKVHSEFENHNRHLENNVQEDIGIDAWTDEEIFDFYEDFGGEEGGDKDIEENISDAMIDEHIEDEQNDGLSEQVELEHEVTGGEIQKRSHDSERTKKTRGPTMMHAVHMREHRVCIILNKFGQPIGPDDATLDEFSSFLGTIAHCYEFAPLVVGTWKRMPDKNSMWDYVLSKYDVDLNGKKWVLSTIGSAWRVHKCRFKEKFCSQYKDNKSRWSKRPKEIPEKDFRMLLKLWNCKDYQQQCNRKKANRALRKDNPTTGRKSFAKLRAKLQTTLPNDVDIPLSTMYEVTRKRTEGRQYKSSYEDTATKIIEMKNYEAENNEEGEAAIDGYAAIMSKEKSGGPIMCGRGVTKKDLVNTKETVQSLFMTSNDMETVMSTLRKEIEEKNEKKDAEIEQMRKE
ncbi:unnamed protein product, partial [Cuscuta epithymum]